MMVTAPGEMPRKSRFVPWLAISVILLILAASITLITLHLRKFMRAQIIQQDGLKFYAASLEDQIDPAFEDPVVRFAAIEQKILDLTTRHGVVAVRLYDDHGELQLAIPPKGATPTLAPTRLEALRRFETFNSFDPKADLSEISYEEEGAAPLLRALVPLEDRGKFVGGAEFVLDGQKVAANIAALDGDLISYSLLIFILAGGIISLSLLWAFGRLQRSNRLLTERTRSLLRANHELTLSAKTAALGAITAHLIHDLKSPLFGLQSFVSARGSADEEDWDVARDTAQRMQKMISDVVRILQEEKTVEKYQISLDELLSILSAKLLPDVRKMGIHFETQAAPEILFSNRDANILLLVTTNLARNALQATPRGGKVWISADAEKGSLFLRVSDNGPGLPSNVLANLFTPCASSKAGGTGLGLAISKQLAKQIGADLLLEKTSAAGTTFQVRLPEKIADKPTPPANSPEAALVS